MEKKLLGIFACMLLIATIIPISTANEQPISQSLDDVEITIYAGHFGKDIGFGISIAILNHRSENITVYYNITRDRVFRNDVPTTFHGNVTVPSERPWGVEISIGDGIRNGLKYFRIYFISISVEGGNTRVSRKGITIGEIMIFNE